MAGKTRGGARLGAGSKKMAPTREAWIRAATEAATEAGVCPVAVMAGVGTKAVQRARWAAWRAIMANDPSRSFLGLADVSGFHHTTILNALGRLSS